MIQNIMNEEQSETIQTAPANISNIISEDQAHEVVLSMGDTLNAPNPQIHHADIEYPSYGTTAHFEKNDLFKRAYNNH